MCVCVCTYIGVCVCAYTHPHADTYMRTEGQRHRCREVNRGRGVKVERQGKENTNDEANASKFTKVLVIKVG